MSVEPEEIRELKPCPFCSSENVVCDSLERDDDAELPQVYYIMCKDCQGCGSNAHTEHLACVLWDVLGGRK